MKNIAPEFAPLQNGEKRLDLALEGDESVIQLSTWTEGLGWCVQKTIRLDAEMLGEMHRLIGAARVKIRNRLSAAEEPSVTDTKVLNFPVVA